MTRKRYYTDAYQQRFEARIREIAHQDDGSCQVILSESYFYPESGGQPADHGRLGGVPVTNVTIRAEDQAIIHTLASPISANLNDMAIGEIDWERRFNHMQQHTGQHILSRAFVDRFDSDTVGFHLSSDYCTIDLDRSNFTLTDIEQAEQLANRVVWQNRPIYTRFVSHQQAERLPLRKRPPVQESQIRLIEIDGFDLNACGGTHVTHTGEVGQIKITKVEKRKKKLRLTFLCGSRAWQDYQDKNGILTALTNELTTGQDALLDTIKKLRQEIKQKNKTIKRQSQALMALEIDRLREQGAIENGISWITKIYNTGDQEIGELRPLANRLTQGHSNTIVLLGKAGDKAQLVFKRTADLDQIDLSRMLQKVSTLLNSHVGGGSPDFAHISGIVASVEQIEQAFHLVKDENGRKE